jgi:hypothetical protein
MLVNMTSAASGRMILEDRDRIFDLLAQGRNHSSQVGGDHIDFTEKFWGDQYIDGPIWIKNLGGPVPMVALGLFTSKTDQNCASMSITITFVTYDSPLT